MSKIKPIHKLIAMMLSIVMVLWLIPVPAVAEATEATIGTSGEIIAFKELAPEITAQNVPLGTYEDKLNLPETLTATVCLEAVLEEPVPVTWVSSPGYDADKAGIYTFTPKAEGFDVSAQSPIITVTVGQASKPKQMMLNTMLLTSSASIPYLDENGQAQNAAVATKIEASSTGLSSGWYYVEGSLNINQTITVTGNIKLILMDGCDLTVTGSDLNAGVYVSEGNSLTIYAQSQEKNMGKLTATGGYYGAGIGGSAKGANGVGGTVTINGGLVNATGGDWSAGIGGGTNGADGTVTVNGGIVNAKGGSTFGAGIGGGANGDGGTVTINGGTVTAIGDLCGAGIGGGVNGAGGNITINKGMVKATGGEGSAGIGGGGGQNSKGNGGTVTINDGTVIATGGGIGSKEYGNGAGIGGGANGTGGTITIKGGTVTATGGYYCAGIGGGYRSSYGDGAGGKVEISGLQTVVTAKGQNGGKDVGSACSNKSGGTLTVSSGATLILSQNGTNANITVSGGTITGEGAMALTIESGSPVVFLLQPFGYSPVEGKTITLKNSGIVTLNVKTELNPDSKFEISTVPSTISAGGTATVNIKPKDNLPASFYEDTLQITGINGAFSKSVSVPLKFTVKEPTPTASIDYSNEQLAGLTANAEYTISGAAITTDTNGKISINDDWLGKTLSIVKTNMSPAASSDLQSLPIPSRLAAPSSVIIVAETVVGNNDGKLTGLTTAMEYRKQGSPSWTACPNGNVENLCPGTYEVRYKATSTVFASTTATPIIGVGVSKTYILTLTPPAFGQVTAGYTQPNAQAIIIKNSGNSTANITNVTVSPDSAFIISGSDNTVAPGQSINTWGIQPKAWLSAGIYTATISVAHSGGTATTSLTFTVKESTPTASVDYSNEQLTGLTANASYAINSEVKAADKDGKIQIGGDWLGKTLSIVKTNTSSCSNSDSQSLEIPVRLAAPSSVSVVPETVVENNDGKLTGLTTAMEYHKQGVSTWTACPNGNIDNLSPGSYEVRYKATDSAFASTSSTLTIADGAEKSYILTITPPAFTEVTAGYTQPLAQSITIQNNGNSTVNITNVTASPDSAFIVSGSGITVAPGQSIDTWKIQPKSGLSAGTYSATISVIYNGGTAIAQIGFSVRGSSKSKSNNGSTLITNPPGKNPNQPVTAATAVTATAGANGAANATISEKAVADAIAKAQADAKSQGKTANGISMALNVTMPKNAVSLSATLTQNTLQSLASTNVTSLEINGAPISVSFDQKAIQSISSQSDGNVTITITPAKDLSMGAKALIGTRPVYNITLSYVKSSKAYSVTTFGNGRTTVSIPYTPDKNEALSCLYAVYVDDNGNATRITDSTYDTSSGCMRFTTAHFSIYGVGYTAPSTKFTDISKHWAKESIDYMVVRGLLDGTSDTTFSPNTAMSRGMLVTILGRLSGTDISGYKSSNFTDVISDKYYLPYIEWAYQKGIVTGIGNKQFAPDKAITREEVALILQRYAKATGYSLPVTCEAVIFTDSSDIGSSFTGAVKAMQQAGILNGKSNSSFNPKRTASRAEVSAMLYRYIKLTIDSAMAQD